MHILYFKVYTDKNASQIEIYLDALIKENEIYSHTRVSSTGSSKFAYFGRRDAFVHQRKQLTICVEASIGIVSCFSLMYEGVPPPNRRT